MTKYLLRPCLLGLFFCVSYSFSNAQTQTVSESNNQNIIVVGAKKTAQITGKVAYFVVKETANVGWEVTKFTAKEVAAPVASTILLKAPPKIAKYLLKKSLPASKKLIVSYLKYKLPL